MQALVDALKAEALSIGTCESLTGGMFASELTSVPGVSAVFKGGFVTYWNTCKIDVVHVSAETIDKYGVVSAPTAIEMAEKSRRLLECGCCISFTGNAGPDVLEGKPAGLVYSAVAFDDAVYVYKLQLSGERNALRHQVCEVMKEILRQLVGSRHAADFEKQHQRLLENLGIMEYNAYIKSVKEQNHG